MRMHTRFVASPLHAFAVLIHCSGRFKLAADFPNITPAMLDTLFTNIESIPVSAPYLLYNIRTGYVCTVGRLVTVLAMISNEALNLCLGS